MDEDLRDELCDEIEKWIPGPVFPPLLDGMKALVERRVAQARAETLREAAENIEGAITYSDERRHIRPIVAFLLTRADVIAKQAAEVASDDE